MGFIHPAKKKVSKCTNAAKIGAGNGILHDLERKLLAAVKDLDLIEQKHIHRSQSFGVGYSWLRYCRRTQWQKGVGLRFEVGVQSLNDRERRRHNRVGFSASSTTKGT